MYRSKDVFDLLFFTIIMTGIFGFFLGIGLSDLCDGKVSSSYLYLFISAFSAITGIPLIFRFLNRRRITGISMGGVAKVDKGVVVGMKFHTSDVIGPKNS